MLGFKTRPKPWQWGKYVAVALTTSACSLQDYTYLGAGAPNTDTTDETSTDGSETTEPDAAVTTDVTDTVDIDASVPEGGMDDGGDMTTGPVLTDQTDETDTTMVDTSDTTAVDTTDVSTSDTDPPDAGPEAPLEVPGNLITNSSFENPLTGWYGFGNSAAAGTEDRAHTGVRALVSVARGQGTWEGPALNILTLTGGQGQFRVRAWVQTETTDATINVSLKSVCPGVPNDAGVATPVETYTPLNTVVASATAWHLLDGLLTVPDCELMELHLYFEGPPVNAVFYVDDVSMVPN